VEGSQKIEGVKLLLSLITHHAREEDIQKSERLRRMSSSVEEHISSIFRVEKSARVEEPADASSTLTEAILSPEASIDARSTQRHIPEDEILHSHRCENLKS
jgi:hypothetical protein